MHCNVPHLNNLSLWGFQDILPFIFPLTPPLRMLCINSCNRGSFSACLRLPLYPPLHASQITFSSQPALQASPCWLLCSSVLEVEEEGKKEGEMICFWKLQIPVMPFETNYLSPSLFTSCLQESFSEGKLPCFHSQSVSRFT